MPRKSQVLATGAASVETLVRSFVFVLLVPAGLPTRTFGSRARTRRANCTVFPTDAICVIRLPSQMLSHEFDGYTFYIYQLRNLWYRRIWWIRIRIWIRKIILHPNLKSFTNYSLLPHYFTYSRNLDKKLFWYFEGANPSAMKQIKIIKVSV